MNWNQHCAAVIPCLNEARTIAQVVREVQRHFATVIVVDDGSEDETGRWATDAGATVLHHDHSRGKGAALNTGLCWLWRRHFRWALLMDGDGQHAASDIPALLGCAEQTGASLIIGNRMLAPAAMPWLRRRANAWMSARLSRLAGRALPDTQCGFRLLSLTVWSGLQLETTHFETESELVLGFVARGERIGFVPVRVIYGAERTKIKLWTDSWRWFRWWWRMRCSFPPNSEREGSRLQTNREVPLSSPGPEQVLPSGRRYRPGLPT